MNYEPLMKRALELALRGIGYVSPNPRVGAVIIDNNGNIIAEGWHKFFGGPHAEVEAINMANLPSFENHTLIVTMEPCNFYGKTPPCTDLIIEKKFSKVVIGALDPNPKVNGQGVEKLRSAGIEVITGVLEDECNYLNRYFAKFINHKKPYIILKVAQTIDGNIALKNGQSKWITSEESRLKVQELRIDIDAVLVGKNTILMDNPFLTVRDFDAPNPKKVILDAELTLPLDLNIFKNPQRESTILFCSKPASKSRKANTLSLAGIKIEPIANNEFGFLNLNDVLSILSEKYNIASLMVEGGSQVFTSFIKENLVDEFHIFIAPKILGAGLQAFSHLMIPSINQASELDIISFEKTGPDYHITAKLKNKS